MAHHVYVWEFRVKPDLVPEFQQAYGPAGEWVRLFRRAEGYLRTELLRDVEDPCRFITVDEWRSREDYDRFRANFAAEYAAMDAACAAYSLEERLLGNFIALDAWRRLPRSRVC